MVTTFSYAAKITGHEPPFRWEVTRLSSEGTSPASPNNCRGEADSYEEALIAADEAARSAEWKRKHDATIEIEDLFVVEDEQISAAHMAPDYPPQGLTSV